ncbi:GNAT family N-acetyltransferase [Bacillus sp. CGMCC 1.16607]|uniref:GNAT family N-acetyltransferase n=1 Tax=Bacillus sp. CGMCC 1.16607 TaxID=3351842 RepID=UPI0036325455
MSSELNYRLIDSIHELEQVVELQIKIWGSEATTHLPQLLASAHNGGIVNGAFNKENLIGFCYAFPGYKNNNLYLCSHMLGILPSYRNGGIGSHLKLEQRKRALECGYRKIIWTFDPLQTRNAYLNLNRLGGYVREYYTSHYGEMKDKINIGLPTDRLLLEWDIDSSPLADGESGDQKSSNWKRYHLCFKWSIKDDLPYPNLNKGLENGHEGYLLPVPTNIDSMKDSNLELAYQWRIAIRNLLIPLLNSGYQITGLLKNEQHVHYYVVEKLHK